MKLTLLLLAMVLSLATHAGQGGNGGGAFVCRNSAGKILSSQLVDLYEADAQYDLTVKRDSRLTVDEQVDLAALRIQGVSNNFYLAFDPHLAEVRQILRVVPNAKLEDTRDFDILVSPKTCADGTSAFEQLANYTDEGQLIVDEEIWNSLPTTDKAALYIHEAVYSYLRKEDKVITSRRSRQITGYAFANPSKSSFKLLLDTAILSGEYKCTGKPHIYNDEENNFRIIAELPTMGEASPLYRLEADVCTTHLCGNGVSWYHKARFKEVSNGEFQGALTSTLRRHISYSNYDFNTLTGGEGFLRRLSDGTLEAELSWAVPPQIGTGIFGSYDINRNNFYEPKWFKAEKFTGCKRTGPIQKL